MGNFKQFCVGISGAFFALFASAFLTTAHAAIVTWYLNDVTFDDGGTAEGSFDYDADTNTYSDIDITTYDAEGILYASYGTPHELYPPHQNRLYTVSSYSAASSGASLLWLLWGLALDNEGGRKSIGSNSHEFLCGDADCYSLSLRLRTIETGYFTSYIVSEVPLPAALPLFIAGLAGVGAIGRRRKARALQERAG